MLDYNKQRQLIVVCVLAIILIVILAIIYIVNIWIPEPEKEYVYEVGNVEYSNVEEEDILLQHYKRIEKILMNSDIEQLCSLVGEDYLKYYDYTLDDVKAYIESKSILGKKLELVNSATYSISGYSNVFYLDIKAVSEVYSINVIVKEVAPEQYTIAFDKFIDYKEQVYNGAVNSVNLQVLKSARFTTSVEYRVRITNNYDKAITINTNKEVDGLVLVSESTGVLKKPIMSLLANQAVTLEPGTSREYTVNYNIVDDTDYMLYKVLVLKGVSYAGLSGTSNLEFYMN